MRVGVSRHAGTRRDRFEESLFGGWTWRSLPERRMKVGAACLIAGLVVMVGLVALALIPGAPESVLWGGVGVFFALLAAYLLLWGYAYWVSWRPSRAKQLVDRLTLHPEDMPSGWVMFERKRESNVGEWEEELREWVERSAELTIDLDLLGLWFTDMLVPVGSTQFSAQVQDAAAAGRITGSRVLLMRRPPRATDDSGPTEIASDVIVYRTAAQAHEAFIALAGEQLRAGAGVVGEESFAALLEHGNRVMLTWRTDNVIATLATAGTVEERLPDLLPLARVQNDRIFTTLTRK
jgi:hypothetical protein